MPSFLAIRTTTIVREIMTPAGHVLASETVRDAAARLMEFGTAALPVVGEDGFPKGTFNRGHVLGAVTMGRDATKTTVGELCTGGRVIEADSTIDEALAMMRALHVPQL